MKIQQRAHLGVFSLAMMSVAGIFTLRTLPLMAGYDLSAIFYYLVAALLFFIPSALVCAELAAGWPKTGGLYVWIREAFGARFGFLAIWLEWTNTIISLPATLAFIVATFVYAFNPTLANNHEFMFLTMVAILWGSTFLNFLGIKYSSWFSTAGLLLGTMIPCFFIIALAIFWLYQGQPIQMAFSWKAFIPHNGFHSSAFLVGLLLGYAGMQVAGFHAQETKDPQRDYPKAIFAAVGMILFLSVFGTIAISLVIPAKNISVVTGLIAALKIFLAKFNLSWLMPLFAILMAIGTLSMMNLWIIGPAKGLLATAREGDLPKILRKTNRFGAPTIILLCQAIVGTLFALLYLFTPTISASYWMLIDLTALLTLIMYTMLFLSVIRLRYSQPNVPRGYKIPGGRIGVWLIGGTGAIVSFFAFFLGFFPPSQLQTGSELFYELFLIIGVGAISLLPFLLPHLNGDT